MTTINAETVLAHYTAEELDHAIDLLELEAGTAGDLEMVEICRRALDGDASARRTCAEAIASARAVATYHGDLHDHATGEYLGPATAEHLAASLAADPLDVGAFRDLETGRTLYVDLPSHVSI